MILLKQGCNPTISIPTVLGCQLDHATNQPRLIAGNVRLPSQSSFALDAHSGSGGIQSKHRLTTQGAVRENQLKGTAGNGSAQLYIRTGSGSIQID